MPQPAAKAILVRQAYQRGSRKDRMWREEGRFQVAKEQEVDLARVLKVLFKSTPTMKSLRASRRSSRRR